MLRAIWVDHQMQECQNSGLFNTFSPLCSKIPVPECQSWGTPIGVLVSGLRPCSTRHHGHFSTCCRVYRLCFTPNSRAGKFCLDFVLLPIHGLVSSLFNHEVRPVVTEISYGKEAALKERSLWTSTWRSPIMVPCLNLLMHDVMTCLLAKLCVLAVLFIHLRWSDQLTK